MLRLSSVREIDALTFKIKRELRLKSDIFAEEIVVIKDHIYLLTWTNKFTIVIDKKKFQIVGNYLYTTHTGEGWGLTYNGKHFIISDGSSRIQFFNMPDINKLLNLKYKTSVLVKSYETIVKRSDGVETQLLNELQYNERNGFIYSNVWYTNRILKIDISNGIINKLIDLQSLYPSSTRTITADCLNGIAYNKTNDTHLLTGKLWPLYYNTKFLP
jgi:glutamine cyclotransferase